LIEEGRVIEGQSGAVRQAHGLIAAPGSIEAVQKLALNLARTNRKLGELGVYG